MKKQENTQVTSWFRSGGAFLLLLTALLFSTSALAQQTGEIAGKVTNVADGSPIAEVAIEATGNTLPGIRTTTTNANGDYRLPLLPPGKYTLTYTLPDGSARLLATEVLLQQRTTVNFPIDLTASEGMEEVTVIGAAPILESSGSTISSSINNETFDALPVGQEYRDLIKLIPGVQFTQDAVRGPSAGGNGQDNTYQFDGVDVSLPLFGTLSAEPSTHDIDQVSIVRGGSTAVGFNRSGGFKVNTISKSGTNEFDGMVSYQLQDSSWEADRDYESSQDFKENKDWIVANVSGPIIKDKLFFYASYYAPTTKRDNRANVYGDVPDFKSERDEYFGKLTWAPTDNLLFDASYRTSDSESRNSGIGAFTHPDASWGSDASLDIAILEGNWIVSDNSSAYFKFTDFENKTNGRPDISLDSVRPSIGGSLDLNNLDRMGRFNVPSDDPSDPAYSAFAQPYIDQYGFVQDGVKRGGGVVGVDDFFNKQDFSRTSFELGYDLSLEFGDWRHDLHFGYHQEEIEEFLLRSSNGWGRISAPGGREDFDGQPVYFIAEFFQTSLGEYGIPPIQSYVETQNIEINDSISWNDWTFNVGVLFSQDELFGQGLKVNKSNLSGYEAAPGNKYSMHKESFGDMIQPRLGVTWDFTDDMTAFANYARYYPSATSLARAASWDRNLHTEIEAYFDANGQMIGVEPDQSSSGKLFQEGIDPRHIDEYIIGLSWQVSDSLSTRFHYRRREQRDMWEDTWNWTRESYACAGDPAADPGCMPQDWAPATPYIPELNDYRAEIGGSSYVIAALDRAYTDYDEISAEFDWQGDRWYINGSYTWSRYRGNFDQDNTTVGNDANVFIGSSWLADGWGRQLWDNKDGKLKGDRPHLLKLYGYYELSWNAVVGAYALYQSGQVWETWDGTVYGYSPTVSNDRIRYAEPAGSRRSGSHTQLDLNYTQNFMFGNRYAVQLRADIFNVFDNQTGYNIEPRIHSAGYGDPRSYYNPRRLQLTAKFLF